MSRCAWYLMAMCWLVGADTLIAQPRRGPSNSMDGKWEAYEVEIRDGKKRLRCPINDVGMVIKNGTGTWSSGTSRGTIKVDLSMFEDFAPYWGSAPFDLAFTEGREKGQTWEGICSRCGLAAIVCVSLKKRPEDFEGSDAQPVILFRFKLKLKEK